jgi:hypothetical protein
MANEMLIKRLMAMVKQMVIKKDQLDIAVGDKEMVVIEVDTVATMASRPQPVVTVAVKIVATMASKAKTVVIVVVTVTITASRLMEATVTTEMLYPPPMATEAEVAMAISMVMMPIQSLITTLVAAKVTADPKEDPSKSKLTERSLNEFKILLIN